jgi:hypothetical protein
LSSPATPAKGACCGQPGDQCNPQRYAEAWMTPAWSALNFSQDDPFRFSYEFVSAGVGKDAIFTVSAYGDLDCDGDYSTFLRAGRIDANNNVIGTDLFVAREQE